MTAEKKEFVLSQELLKSMFIYDVALGVFIFKKGHKKGYEAGSKTRDGHWRITIKRKHYYSHRLAWLYVYGKWPNFEIDHTNGDPSDNGIHNLREVTKSQNVMNRVPSRINTTGFRGLYYDRKRNKWLTRGKVLGKIYFLGRFETKIEAIKEREEFEDVYFGEFSTKKSREIR